MATYTETFSGQTTGSNSTTFTDRYDAESFVSVENPSLGEQDSRVLQFGSSDSGFIFQSFDSVDADANRDNCEILARYRLASDAGGQSLAIARASGSGGSETCYAAYVKDDDFTISRFDSGTESVISSTPTGSYPSSSYVFGGGDDFASEPTGIWVWVRFRVNGTGATVTLQGKWWKDGFDEPENWIIDTTDTTGSRITTAGWVGFGKQDFTGNTYLDFFGVGTNSDTAPLPASDTSNTLRVTNVHGQVLYSGGPVRVTNTYVQVLYETPATVSAGHTVVAMISC